MRATDLMRLSLGYALRRRWRAIPSLVGVVLGVTVLVIVLTAAETIHRVGGDQILGQQSLRQITVSSPAVPGGRTDLTNELVLQLGGINHVTAAYPVTDTHVPGMIGEEGYVVPVGNLPPAVDRPRLLLGHWPEGSELVLPESGLKDKTGASVPGNRLMGKTLVLQTRSLQGLGDQTKIPLAVVGIYHDPGSATGEASAYAPLGVVDHLVASSLGETDDQYRLTATYPEAIVDVDTPQNVAGVANAIETRGLTTFYVEKKVSGLTGHLQGIELTGAYLAGAVVLLCLLSVGNMVASSVRQRRSELGIMLAIGFRHWMLAAVVAGEVFATGLAGALVGIAVALSAIGAFALTHPSAGVVLPVASLPVVTVLTAILCLLVGLVPARKVMRMDCIEAIRAE